MNNSRLEVTYENEALVIRIGKDVLSKAFEISKYNNPFSDKENDFIQQFKVVDSIEFTNSIIEALKDEREDGSTLVTNMLDEAMITTLELFGCDGIEDVTEEER